jgi:hypothetical protein
MDDGILENTVRASQVDLDARALPVVATMQIPHRVSAG